MEKLKLTIEMLEEDLTKVNKEIKNWMELTSHLTTPEVLDRRQRYLSYAINILKNLEDKRIK